MLGELVPALTDDAAWDDLSPATQANYVALAQRVAAPLLAGAEAPGGSSELLLAANDVVAAWIIGDLGSTLTRGSLALQRLRNAVGVAVPRSSGAPPADEQEETTR